MKRISVIDLERLLRVHSPVRIRTEDFDMIEAAERIKSERQDVIEAVKEMSPPLSSHDVRTITGLDDVILRRVELIERLGDRAVGQYPSMASTDTGGYILPGGDVPRVVLSKLVHNAAGTKVKIIDVNRYRSYDDAHNMLVEMVDNAYEHGNRFDRNKVVYLLWHKCASTREIMIVDQGVREFTEGEAHKRRMALAHGFGKFDDYSGVDLLNWDSRYHGFFGVYDGKGNKRGTILKIGLNDEKKAEKAEEKCPYLGHTLLV